jgi:hypothetical protein
MSGSGLEADVCGHRLRPPPIAVIWNVCFTGIPSLGPRAGSVEAVVRLQSLTKKAAARGRFAVNYLILIRNDGG